MVICVINRNFTIRKTSIMRYIILLFFLQCTHFVFSQDTLLGADFEGSSIPAGWSQVKIKGDPGGIIVEWITKSGGHNGFPSAAAFGSKNAFFFYENYENEATKLVSPPINLSNKIKPVLSFWHAMMVWNYNNTDYWDKLSIYCRKNITSQWRLLKDYNDPQPTWIQRVVQIPDSLTSSSTYISFQGETGYAHGVCIDNALIYETEIKNRRVFSDTVFQASTNFVSSGMRNAPILRIDLNIFGNTGDAPLKSLIVKSLNTSDGDILASGVKLYYTEDSIFKTNMQIGSGVSFIGGKAIFNGLNFLLPTGKSSIWITFDLSSSAVHEHIIDAMIESNAMNIKDTLYPSKNISPNGSRIVYETIFSDNFETNKGWSFGGEFQRSKPLGLGGNEGGNPDPTLAYSGDTIIGTDLTGLGSKIGNYETAISDRQFHAISPSINCKYFKDIKLSYQRWLNMDLFDRAFIDVSADGGTTWHEIFKSKSFLTEIKWSFFSNDISRYANRSTNLKIRFSVGPSSLSDNYSGWNIDDVILTGDFITTDVGIARRISPQSGTGFTNSEPVTVVVKNFGAFPSPSLIPIKYYFNDGRGTIFSATDTILGSIASEDSVVFTFKKRIDLSMPGIFSTAIINTLLSTDEYKKNDTNKKHLYIIPTYNLPYTQNFETDLHFWLVNKTIENTGSTWSFGQPSGITINSTYSGINAWATSLAGPYKTNDSSFVYSPSFNFTTASNPIFEFKNWTDCQSYADGVNIQYTINNGVSWKTINRHTYPFIWNWYANDSLTGTNQPGWTGTASGWSTTRQFLPPDVVGKIVTFRVYFKSDTLQTDNEGFAFDDVRVLDCPHDIGVDSIESPDHACTLSKTEKPIIRVHNFGKRDMRIGDTIIIGFILNGASAVRDTQILSSPLAMGASIPVTFKKAINMFNRGIYSMKAFTALPSDMNIYSDTPYNNDSASKVIAVNKPYFTLGADRATVKPDTIVFNAYAGTGHTYAWSTGKTTSSITNLVEGTYSVTVTNNIPCQTSDTVILIRLIADAGVTAVIAPVSACLLSVAEPIRVRITNFGDDTIHTNHPIDVYYQIDGKTPHKETAFAPRTLKQDSSFIYTFGQTADFSAIRSYTITSYTKYLDDSLLYNDTNKVNITVHGLPAFNLFPDDTTHPSTRFKLNAMLNNRNSNLASFKWSDNSSDSTLLVQYPGGTFFVTATDIYGCSTSDSAIIFMQVPDIGVTRISSPNSHCGTIASANIVVTISNIGTDIINPGISIPVSWKVNGGNATTNTFQSLDTFRIGDTLVHTFTNPIDLSIAGSYYISCYTAMSQDSARFNDTILKSVYIYSQPIVNLGKDTIVVATSYVLHAGNGFASYLWHDSTQANTFTCDASNARKPLKAKVDVIDIYGCPASDSLIVRLKYEDLAVTSISPDTVCGFDNKQSLSVNLLNLGTDTIYRSILDINYQVGSGDFFTETFQVQEQLAPDSTYVYNLISNPGIKTGNTYSMQIYIDFSNDDVSSNDILNTNIYVRGRPVINWGVPVSGDTLRQTLPYDLIVPDAFTTYPSYQWNNGSTNKRITVLKKGWYSVTVVDNKGCMNDDSLFIINTIGVSETMADGSKISLYPNPSKEYVVIEIEATQPDRFTLELYNAKSQIILQQQTDILGNDRKILDLSSYTSGLYYIKVSNKKGYKILKLIVRK